MLLKDGKVCVFDLLTRTDYPPLVSGKLDQSPSVLRSDDCLDPHLEVVWQYRVYKNEI